MRDHMTIEIPAPLAEGIRSKGSTRQNFTSHLAHRAEH